MSLVLFMLLAQGLYTISSFGNINTNSKLCFALGVALHFCWLLSIFWMNICTFHLFRVFSKIRVLSNEAWLKIFVGYHCFAIVLSFVFVTLNITLSLLLSGKSGYGGSNCYISSQKMINYTFVFPTCFVVLTNIIMFVYVIIKIKSISSIPRHLQNKRNDLNVFVKLSTITGVTWIFGIMYTWTNVIVFSYLFITLNASQGVFIMLAFVRNDRVFNFLKTRSLKSNSSSTRSSTFES
jgi:hypothetical protein